MNVWRAEGRGLYERCERIIRGWDQWSPAEQRKMDGIVGEIMGYVVDGVGGNAFIRNWVQTVLLPKLREQDNGR